MRPLEICPTCPGCRVATGETHKPGCDVERCPFCGRQMLQDKCCYRHFGIEPRDMERTHPDMHQHGLPDDMAAIWEDHLRPHLLPWDGTWPGVKECRDYNIWSKWTAKGWQDCSADDPDANEDLNLLAELSQWDPEQKRYVIPDALLPVLTKRAQKIARLNRKP
jgi:hypothetical protein